MTQEQALDKVAKLLRLSKSSNPNEAALAAARAQEIMTRYSLDVDAADFESQQTVRDNEPIKDFGSIDPVDIVPPMGLHGRGWALRLLSVIARVNSCISYYSQMDSKGTKRLCVIGRPSDVQTVRYLYAYFKSEVVRLRRENTKGQSNTYANHYCIGVTDAITHELYKQQNQTFEAVKAEHQHNPQALIRVNQSIAKLEARREAVGKWAEDNMDFVSGRRSGYTTAASEGGRAHGQRDGSKVRYTKSRGGLGRGVAGELN